MTFIAGTLGQGGAERQLYYILSALQTCGARTRVLCLTRGEFWEERVRELGVPVTWVGASGSRLARLGAIVARLRADRPRVVQSQHFYTNLYACAAARLLGAHEVGALRSDAVNEVSDGGRVLGRLSLTAPRHIVANSQTGIANAVALGARAHRLTLLGNVVDTDAFRPAPRAANGAVTLLAVGRLGPEKRFDRLLTALAELRRETAVPFRALIVGDGPERAALENMARSLDLLPHIVRFCGPVADVATVYAAADLLVLTSDWEGTPNVVLEAMAAGLPVVATTVGDVRHLVVDDRTGLLVSSGDAAALRRGCLRLIEDPALRRLMGDRARAEVLARHSLQQLPQRLDTVYREVLQ